MVKTAEQILRRKIVKTQKKRDTFVKEQVQKKKEVVKQSKRSAEEITEDASNDVSSKSWILILF